MEVVLTGTFEETEVVDVDRNDHPPWPVTIVSLVSIHRGFTMHSSMSSKAHTATIMLPIACKLHGESKCIYE